MVERDLLARLNALGDRVPPIQFSDARKHPCKSESILPALRSFTRSMGGTISPMKILYGEPVSREHRAGFTARYIGLQRQPLYYKHFAMYVLGISSFAHEAACALIKNGNVCCVYEEERFNREKHTWKFPVQSIRQCLQDEGITIHDIDAFTFFWKPIREITNNIGHVLRYFPKSLSLIFTKSCGVELPFLERIAAKQWVGKRLKKEFGMTHTPKVHFVEHHLAHAASAFFSSSFDEAAILTVDGRGESESTVLAGGKGCSIKKIESVHIPHSLGHLYASVTDYLGFLPFSNEWKVMGMSAYGKDTYVKAFKDVIQLLDNGLFRLNLNYFRFHTHGCSQWLSPLFEEIFGPKRNPNDPYDQRHYDIAYALQHAVERAGVHVAQHLHTVTEQTNLCMAGGVTLNCLMNKRIIEETSFENFYFMPIANDAGTALGSALYYYHHMLKQDRQKELQSVYLGSSFSNEEIEAVLQKEKVAYRRCENIAAEAARHIADGKITGWFQGRMEAGPRALGNRSIVVSPLDKGMKDKLNERVKKREFFRPFAPSVLEEKVGEYFRMPKGQPSPHMMLIGDVLDDKKEVIPAVTHADGTARVQTVSKQINPRYWELISEFEKITKVPVLLNTSFNENEPIVRTPEEAVNCFFRTEFDCLAIGDFWIVKEDQPKKSG